MFVTTVDGSVSSDREQDLRDAWKRETTRPRPAGLIESLLLSGADGHWRIVTVWESREAVMAMRAAGPPAALVMFESAGSSATVSMWMVDGILLPL